MRQPKYTARLIGFKGFPMGWSGRSLSTIYLSAGRYAHIFKVGFSNQAFDGEHG
jgi:hypothetical protein